jgi:hypothetical protein
MFFRDSSDYLYKTLSDISMRGLDYPEKTILTNTTSNINLVNSLILGFSLFILLTFLFFPNPLLNIVFESLAISLF